MGRKSRLKRERRALRTADRREASRVMKETEGQSNRIKELEEELTQMADGDTAFGGFGSCPPDLRESHLEDVRAFESLSSGPSLFEGLEANGVRLPPPDKLNERKCAKKVLEILRALARVQVFIIGFEHWSPKEAYKRFWEETLWEGCYVEKKTPGAITVMDASHSLSRSEVERSVQDLFGPQFVN